jgi:hypothetical protein
MQHLRTRATLTAYSLESSSILIDSLVIVAGCLRPAQVSCRRAVMQAAPAWPAGRSAMRKHMAAISGDLEIAGIDPRLSPDSLRCC